MYEPQGPLPREVYVRRRVAAAVVALIVVAAVVAALYFASRGEGTDTKDAATQSQEQQSTGESGAPAASSSASPTTGADSASRGRCDDKDLSLTVWPAEPNVATGSPVRFYVQVTNNGRDACNRDLAGGPLTFEVYRLEDNGKVWSSADCAAPTTQDDVVLQPGKPVARQVDWTGRVSSQGACADNARTPAGVGPYQVYALVGRVFSPAATFNLVKG